MGKKIVFLSRYVGKVNRGVESHVKELSKRLLKNYSVEIFADKDADSFKKVLRGKFDLVIPTNGRMQSFKINLGRVVGRYKTLIAGHAGIGRDDIWNLTVAFPDVFVALTDKQFNWAKKWGFASRVVKIPNGVDLENFRPIGKKLKIDLPRPIVLSVGALEWYKHHDKTIQALSQIKKGSLLIVGEGSQRKELEKMGNKLLGKKRFKIAQYPYEKMPEVYRSCDLFALPSWDREAFGIVYLEALASGIPVVGPNDLSRKEIVGKSGILFNRDNLEEHKEALEMALSKSWGDLPRKQAEKFSWESVTRKYNKLIEGMLNG